MKTRNKVLLIGYLGCDPEIIPIANGKSKIILRLATDRYDRDEANNVKRETTWHEISVLGKLVQTIPGNYIKGSHVLVEGRIDYRTSTDKQGTVYNCAQIHAFTLMNLDR